MKIHCQYKCPYSSSYYECLVSKASITKEGTEIISFAGKHRRGKSNDDVTLMWIYKKVIEYFPRGLFKFFPNMTKVHIVDCGLKKITREDLIGLEQLEELYLSKNKLRLLPQDLFIGMNKLKVIRFDGNDLNFSLLSSKVLLPVVGNDLESVDFSSEGRNHTKLIFCPGHKDSVESIQELMSVIDKKRVNTIEVEPIDPEAKNPVNDKSKKSVNRTFGEKLCERFSDLWSSGRYSDFIIIGGKNEAWKKFHVHKCVLGSQSSVLDAKFNDDELLENRISKMEIDDFRAETVEGMLKFIYTGEVQEKNAMDLYAIATNTMSPS
jgi:BTB/POZ domain/Leucine rich repeat